MDQVTFDAYVRRAASLLHWRSLFGGLGATISALGGIPLDAETNKKRVRLCRADLMAVCEGNDECINDLLGCDKMACKSARMAIDCCENARWCDV
jgi:hypothetical protein